MVLTTDGEFSVTDLSNEQIKEVLTDFFRHIDDNEIPVMLFSIANEDPMEEFGDERTKSLIMDYVSEMDSWRKEDKAAGE